MRAPRALCAHNIVRKAVAELRLDVEGMARGEALAVERAARDVVVMWLRSAASEDRGSFLRAAKQAYGEGAWDIDNEPRCHLTLAYHKLRAPLSSDNLPDSDARR